MKLIKNEVKNALSIDLEDWYHGVVQIDYRDWYKYEDRLERNLVVVLGLLNKYHIRATFFILGYIADRFPELIRQIVKSGHEIASHGYHHRLVFEQTPQEFKEDVLHSKKVIESITNATIKGYRAPCFSITKKSLWALNILKELGFEYDSSIFPTKNFLYGIPNAPQGIHRVDGNGLLEFPLSVIKKGRITIPICGGFYMRMLPYALVKKGLMSFNQSKGPAIVYFHPWELDAEKPKINIPVSLKWKIIYDGNIKSMKRKIEQLLDDFRFTTINEVLFGEQE